MTLTTLAFNYKIQQAQRARSTISQRVDIVHVLIDCV